MADDIVLNENTTTGSTVATDSIGGVHYQIVKFTFGALDSQTIASSNAGTADAGTQRVVLPTDQTFAYSFADDAAFTLTTSAVSMAGAIRDDTLSALAAAEADAVPLRVNANGALHVTGASGATEFNEDDAHTTGDAGVQNLAVRNDTLATLCSTDGDYTPLQVSADGALYVEISAGAGGTHVDDAAFTEATDDGVPIFAANGLGVVNAGDAGVVGMSLTRDLYVTERVQTTGGTTLYKNIDVDQTEDQIKATAGQVYWLQCVNLDATPVFLKFYNATAANVTVGTTVPDLTFAVPSQGDANGAGFALTIPQGIAFSTAITVAATTGVADNDSGAPGANEVILNLGYK